MGNTGIAFSPDGKYAYITETGAAQGFYGYDQAQASAMYGPSHDGTTGHTQISALTINRSFADTGIL
jgi:gluconolactonase